MNCPFCGSEAKFNKNGILAVAECEFCGAALTDPDTGYPKLWNEGEGRYNFHNIKANMFLELAEQSVQILRTYHTYDLYLLLKEVRNERASMYHGLHIFNKASDQEDGFKEVADVQGKDYEYWTRRMFVIENILRERQGWFPERIDAKFLSGVEDKIRKCLKKNMVIRKERKTEGSKVK
ncbi:hypothetical protein P4T70_32490 [Bacillus mobilis]|uniref:hypothetical protein n=1 Tax=Bacillus mobilis TaxID=2026190 RepID=UPI002E218296|nr:hypothetical protein [Bacillus mobilis]